MVGPVFPTGREIVGNLRVKSSGPERNEAVLNY